MFVALVLAYSAPRTRSLRIGAGMRRSRIGTRTRLMGRFRRGRVQRGGAPRGLYATAKFGLFAGRIRGERRLLAGGQRAWLSDAQPPWPTMRWVCLFEAGLVAQARPATLPAPEARTPRCYPVAMREYCFGVRVTVRDQQVGGHSGPLGCCLCIATRLATRTIFRPVLL